MDDEDVWGQYARGVKRLGERLDLESAPKDPREKDAPTVSERKEIKPRAQPSLSLDTMPEAWRIQMEGEPKVTTPEPPQPLVKPENSAPTLSKPWKKEPLDVRIERNLSLGDVFIESKLDLHGQTEASAHAQFLAYIDQQQRRGCRLVLVITGKGREGNSVLRANLPRWCDIPPLDDKVLAVRMAAPLHGGDGAYYVLLRKKNA